MPGSRAAVQANYDRLSRWYDRISGSSERRCREAGLELLDAHPGEKILEIGPGTGEALINLARCVGETGRVIGLDLSAGMLREARKKLGQAQPGRPPALIRGDGFALPFASGWFDAVWMSFTLELFSEAEIPAVLGECLRVLRPGGRLAAAVLARPDSPGLPVRLYELAHAWFPRLVDCRPVRAWDCLAAGGFAGRARRGMAIWGLPVELVLGVRK